MTGSVQVSQCEEAQSRDKRILVEGQAGTGHLNAGGGPRASSKQGVSQDEGRA